jgi:hypothetical protein
MKRAARVIIAGVIFLSVCGCHQKHSSSESGDESIPQTQTARDPSETFNVIVDTVKTEKDPKGGWFSPKIQNVYFQHSDQPVVFCGSGPSIPTGKEITIFTDHRESLPESVECNEIRQIVEGRGYWYKGRGFTEKELGVYLDNEEHLIGSQTEGGRNHHMLRAWMKATPIGEPCTDVSGDMFNDVPRRNKGKKCSIVMLNEQYGLFMFINWKVVGNINQSQPLDPEHTVLVGDVLNRIATTYGNKYLFPPQTKLDPSAASGLNTGSAKATQPPSTVREITVKDIEGQYSPDESVRATVPFMDSFLLGAPDSPNAKGVCRLMADKTYYECSMTIEHGVFTCRTDTKHGINYLLVGQLVRPSVENPPGPTIELKVTRFLNGLPATEKTLTMLGFQGD